VVRFSRTFFPCSFNFRKIVPPHIPSEAEITKFFGVLTKDSNCSPERQKMSNMSTIEGYCMKCKTYGPIQNGKEVSMANGRTRYAGFCSNDPCTGKISKIIR